MASENLLKRKTSFIWALFTIKNEKEANCNICKLGFKYGSSTTNLKRHIQNKHPTIDLETQKGKRSKVIMVICMKTEYILRCRLILIRS